MPGTRCFVGVRTVRSHKERAFQPGRPVFAQGTIQIQLRLFAVYRPMKVLVACEFSGVVREAFISLGHEAWSCDLEPSADGGQHIQACVLSVLNDGWDLMIAHPPCTRLCNSGVRWLAERNLWREMVQAAEFFLELLHAPIAKKALENPVPHKYATQIIGRYDQIIQPYEFGEPESKKTCLWLRGLPPLMSTIIETRREQRVYNLPPSSERSRLRSITPKGIARAMAQQWG